MSDEKKKCAHQFCNCTVEPGQHYCSEFCKDSKHTHTIKCDCGHKDCDETYAGRL